MSQNNTSIRKLVAVMFTDIQGYTALMQQNESLAIQTVDLHRSVLEECTKQHQGEVLQFYGDGSLSIYESVVNAVLCAIEMQKTYTKADVPVRIGIHVGDIVRKGDSVFGNGINIASRIQDKGIPGSVLVSQKGKVELDNHPQIQTISIGSFELKNVADPMEIHAIQHPELKTPGLKKPKKSKLKLNLSKILIPIIVLAGLFFLAKNYLPWNGGTAINFDIAKDRIAVPFFTNLTGKDSLDIVSKMASHWISNELIRGSDIDVASYDVSSQVASYAQASIRPEFFDLQNVFENLAKVTYLIEGSYALHGKDSLVFTAQLNNLSTGIYEYSFPPIYGRIQDILGAINELVGEIRGYLASRQENVVSYPNIDAYKDYLRAKELWSSDYEQAEQLLRRATQRDPSFLDAKFLLIDLYYNVGDTEKQKAITDALQAISGKMDQRQKNILAYHENDLNGENILAYKHLIEEYKYDPKDFFNNTTAMVMALEYMHNPSLALSHLEDLPIEKLEYNECEYCLERIDLALITKLQLENLAEAKIIVDRLKDDLPLRKYYSGIIRYYAMQSDTNGINDIIKRASNHELDRDYRYLYYFAAKEFYLWDNTSLASVYAQKVIDIYPTENRTVAWAYNIMGNPQKALQIFQTLWPNDDISTRNLAETGVMAAKSGDQILARKIMEQLEKRIEPYDYGITYYYSAKILAHLGELDRSVSLLERSIKEGIKFYPLTRFNSDPDLFPVLKNHPGYQALMQPKM